MQPSQSNYHSIFRVLQWLKRPVAFRQRTSFMVDPNPRERNSPQYRMRFGNGSTSIDDKLDKERDINTMILAWNSGRRRVYVPDPTSFTYPYRSKLALVYNRDVNLTNPLPPGYPPGTHPSDCPRGPTAVRIALVNVLDAFPKYDLEKDESIERAIQDMTRKLGQVTTVAEFYHLPGAWLDPPDLPDGYDPSDHEVEPERVPDFKLVGP